MVEAFVSLSFATVLTALYGFRYETWQRPKLLLKYFLFFFLLEWIFEYFFFPPQFVQVEMGIICFLIAGVITFAAKVMERIEAIDAATERLTGEEETSQVIKEPFTDFQWEPDEEEGDSEETN